MEVEDSSRVYNSLPLVPKLDQTNLVHSLILFL